MRWGVSGYGAEVAFTTQPPSIPVLTTNPITSITTSASTGGGNVSYDGGASITTRGVCWSTLQNPTIADLKTNDGSGIGSFTSSITGLSFSTTYYVRAYATNSVGSAYGLALSFTTQNPSLPTLTTNAITNIAPTSSTGGGNVSDDGGASITARGVCWNTSQNPTIANLTTTDGTGTGSFTSSITGLSGSITYYVKAYATNSAGKSYGSQVSFTFAVGTSYQGGIVFYIDGTGEHGLIAATTDQSTGTTWGCQGTLINTTSANVGTGQANTTAIVNGCNTAGLRYFQMELNTHPLGTLLLL